MEVVSTGPAAVAPAAWWPWWPQNPWGCFTLPPETGPTAQYTDRSSQQPGLRQAGPHKGRKKNPTSPPPRGAVKSEILLLFCHLLTCL